MAFVMVLRPAGRGSFPPMRQQAMHHPSRHSGLLDPGTGLRRLELLEQLRDRIWAHYGVQLIDQYREQYGPTHSDHPDETTDNPSF
jgi:hypothetical protein